MAAKNEHTEEAVLMVDRANQIKSFLDEAGWNGAEIQQLAGDASFRRYSRISIDNRKAILMDSEMCKENIRPFLSICQHLRSLGYSAPEIFAEGLPSGLILMEDLGDTTFTQRLQGNVKEVQMYEGAVDFLIDLHSRSPKSTIPTWIPTYDMNRYLDEVSLLTDWYMPQISELSETARQDYKGIWKNILPVILSLRNTLVLRDFHADNLMWLPEREDVAACGLLDFQDALAGPPAYDLMSLLEDARRDISPSLVEGMVNRYLAAFPKIRRENFLKSYTILAAQRHCKVIGIFTRLAVRDGKANYLAHIPRVWQMLERACSLPDLAPLKKWLEKWLPEEKRFPKKLIIKT